jgi:hypothetical protein
MLNIQSIEKLYIPNIPEEKQHLFVIIVKEILQKKQKNIETTHLENQIDNLVYRLYDLTYEEVKVIDPKFSLTEEEYNAITLE